MARTLTFIKIGFLCHTCEFVVSVALVINSLILSSITTIEISIVSLWAGIPIIIVSFCGAGILFFGHIKKLFLSLGCHLLLIILLITAITLSTPHYKRWAVSRNSEDKGICYQLKESCNCTRRLPNTIFKCSEITNVHSLVKLIIFFTGSCLLLAVSITLLDFILLCKFGNELNRISPSLILEEETQEIVEKVPSVNNLAMQSNVDLAATVSNDSLPKVENDIPDRDESLDWKSSLPNSPRNDLSNDPKNNGRLSRTSLNGSVSSRPGTGRGDSRPNTGSRPQSRRSIPSRKDSLLRRIQSVEKINVEKNSSRDEEDTQEDLEKEVAALERSLSGTVLDMKRRPTTGSVRGGLILTPLNRPKEDGLPPVPISKPKTHLPSMEDKSASDSSLPSFKDKLPPITPREGKEFSFPGDREESTLGSTKSINDNKQNKEQDTNSNGDTNEENEGGEQQNVDKEYDARDVSADEKNEGKTESMAASIYATIEDDNPGREIDVSVVVGNDEEDAFDKKLPSMEEINILSSRSSKISMTEETNDTSHEDEKDETTTGDVEEDACQNKDKEETEEEKECNGSAKEEETTSGRESAGSKSENEKPAADKEEEPGPENCEEVIKPAKPKWHPPWQLSQEIIAHLPSHSIPCVTLEAGNKWFATGSSDKMIKIWDINTGLQRLTIKAHKGPLRAMIFGQSGHRFLYSAGDDRQLICNDIEVNRIVARFPDQSTVVYSMSLYNPSDILVTSGRDKLVKIWDNRLEKAVRTLRGHLNTVSCVTTIESTRQIVSGSHDSTLRIWDIGEGRCIQILTGHHKSVRALTLHPEDPIISSASTERVIHWQMPQAENIGEILAEGISMNCLAVNPQGVLVAAGSKGSVHLWDWKTGHKFQKIHRTKVYESQEVPICVWTTTFDRTGSKLIASDAGNVIKLYKEAYTRVRRRNNIRDDRSISNPLYLSKRASSLSPSILP